MAGEPARQVSEFRNSEAGGSAYNRGLPILHLIKEDRTTKDIAEKMTLSPRTIETHRKNMRKKLGLEKKKGNLRSRLLTFQ